MSANTSRWQLSCQLCAWFLLLLLLPPLMAPLPHLHWQQNPTGNLFTPAAVVPQQRSETAVTGSAVVLQVPGNTAVCDS